MLGFKLLFKSIGVVLLLIGGICMLLAIAEVASFVGSFDLFGGEKTVIGFINFATIGLFSFILGWVFMDIMQ